MSRFNKRYYFQLFLLTVLFFLSSSFLSSNVYAQFTISQSRPTVTVINPIRGKQLGLEKANLLLSLKNQWGITKDAQVDATWLWQYSALEENSLIDFAKSDMNGQEFGLFLEVDRNLADKADVVYRGRGPWYFSDGLLLVSYDISERHKLIDTIFAKFKEQFGYYPTTVGAWWISADSLSYMQKKYGITASLRAADQFDLDVYSIWGTPWSIPYLPSYKNAGIPAVSWEESIPVVILQWAARDPVKGYGESPLHSTYSVQDYFLKKYDISYLDYLSSIYLKEPSDNLVVGLEGGWEGYEGFYKNHIDQAKKWKEENKVEVRLVKDYAKKFLNRKLVFSDTHSFLTTEFEGTNQSFWYHSPYYRIGILKEGNEISIVDLRDYSSIGSEDFYSLPNSQGYLRVDSHPSIIDSARIPEQKKFLLTSDEPLTTRKDVDTISLLVGDKTVGTFTPSSINMLSETDVYNLSFPFKANTVNVYWIFIFCLIGYFFLVFWQLKNLKKTFIYIAPLVFTVILAKSFLSVGESNTLSFIFDKKQLILSHLLSIFSNDSIFLRILIIFQVLPFVVLFLTHYFLFVRSKKKIQKVIFYFILGFIIVMYTNVPYFPLDRSTYIYVASVFAGIGALLVIGSGLIFYKTKSRKALITSVLLIPVILGICGFVTLISRQEFIITPFEMEALETVSKHNKKIVYLLPVEKPIYKAVRPLIYDDLSVAEKLTHTSWETISRSSKKELKLAHDDQKLLFVPRYIGADISPEEIQKYGFLKVFDNAQIAIFEMR